jgi:5-methylcytosine-specific restriction endonuclease McrA
MRARSKKMAKKYVERRKLVQKILSERPKCERCWIAPSSQVHEILSRARGGSILDEKNCAALCFICHHWITTNPKEAKEQGWLKNSWERNQPHQDDDEEGQPN